MLKNEHNIMFCKNTGAAVTERMSFNLALLIDFPFLISLSFSDKQHCKLV